MNTKQICSHSSMVERAPYKGRMVGSNPPESTRYLIEAYRRGYRVINGDVINWKGNKLKLSKTTNGYFIFNLNLERKPRNIKVHRLVAYQKYGDKIFEEGIQVRHLDNNSENNLDENIGIGTPSQNMQDCPEEDRIERAKNASSHIRKFSNAEVEEIRRTHAGIRSYKQVMEIFDISSKGTLHHILNNDYQTEKMLP